ncbi:MAG: DUF4160 domain-containing protein [Gemmatimonadetes bacterium]|nr:DUF4160 domain-containing protein [Gemmatimonadota bacterium]
MPVVIREGSWRIWIFPRDHGPPHVHVFRRGSVVKIRLRTPGSPAQPAGHTRMSRREMAEAIRLVEKHNDVLTPAWSMIHGLPQSH